MTDIRGPVAYCRFCHKPLSSSQEVEEHEKMLADLLRMSSNIMGNNIECVELMED